MKTQRVALLAGVFYNETLEILQNKNLTYKVILHKKNPEIVNNSYFQSDSRHAIKIIENNDQMLEVLNDFSPLTIISMGWRKILNHSFFNLFKNINLINIHPAILPDYKGYHTEPYIIMNNEKEHGITAHLLSEELDAGDIILQERFPINEFSTVKSIKKEVENIMPLFFERLLGLLNSDTLHAVPQVGETKVVAPKRKAEDSEINTHESIDKLYHSIRACDPDFYPAFFYHNGEKIYIKVWSNRSSKENVLEI